MASDLFYGVHGVSPRLWKMFIGSLMYSYLLHLYCKQDTKFIRLPVRENGIFNGLGHFLPG